MMYFRLDLGVDKYFNLATCVCAFRLSSRCNQQIPKYYWGVLMFTWNFGRRISMAGLSSRTVPHLADAIHAAVTGKA